MREWMNYGVEAFWKTALTWSGAAAARGQEGQEPCARTLLGHQHLCFRTYLHPEELGA